MFIVVWKAKCSNKICQRQNSLSWDRDDLLLRRSEQLGTGCVG